MGARMGGDGGGGERLPRSGTVLWPVVGYLTAGGFLVLAFVDGFELLDLAVVAACALAGGLVFVVLQRPAVAVDAETLYLRGMLSTVQIPLAAVERVAVSRFLAVFAGERRYVSTAVQRSMRAVLGTRRRPSRLPGRASPRGKTSGETSGEPSVDESDLVEQRIGQLAGDARVRAGVRPLSDEQLTLASGVRRTWSAPAAALLVVPVVLLLVVVLVVA